MVNLTAAERVYEYWIDKASSAADLVLKIVFAVILFLVARKLILWLCGLIRKNMRRFHTEEAVVSFTVSMVKYSLNTLLVLTIIVQLGIVSEASIAAAIASAGVAVSLALQGGLSNFAGGVMILLLKPFKVGDYIIFPGEGQEGTVKKIEMYYTTINSIDNRTIMIPNANLTNHTIINVTAMDRRKLEIKVGISYESDIKKAKDILRRLVEKEYFAEVKAAQELNKQVCGNCYNYEYDGFVFVDELGESAITVGLRAWVATENYWPVKWKMNERIKEEFDAAGISIPYNQLDVHICPEPANKKAGKGDK